MLLERKYPVSSRIHELLIFLFNCPIEVNLWLCFENKRILSTINALLRNLPTPIKPHFKDLKRNKCKMVLIFYEVERAANKIFHAITTKP